MPSHHLVIGGQRSGKSRQAERLARAWLAERAQGRVVVVATACDADDAEMRVRIQRHRVDRPAGFATVEEPLELGRAVRRATGPQTLLLVDCLTLWVSNALMPPEPLERSAKGRADWAVLRADFLQALEQAAGPVVVVSNEIGWGVVPLGEGVRHVVDELGRLNQDVAQRCGHVTLMVAGQPWTRAVEGWT